MERWIAAQWKSIAEGTGSMKMFLQFRIAVGNGKLGKLSRHLLGRTKEESGVRLAEHRRVIVRIA
jgi:hypothetical protein